MTHETLIINTSTPNITVSVNNIPNIIVEAGVQGVQGIKGDTGNPGGVIAQLQADWLIDYCWLVYYLSRRMDLMPTT